MSDYWKKRLDELNNGKNSSSTSNYWQNKMTELEEEKKKKKDKEQEAKAKAKTKKQSSVTIDASMYDSPAAYAGALAGNWISELLRGDEDDERTWFQKGALEDGNTFENWKKGSVATTADIKTDFRAGALGVVEGAADTAAWLAPGNLAAQTRGDYLDPSARVGADVGQMLASWFMGEDANYLKNKQNDYAQKLYDESKPAMEQFIKKDLIDEQAVSKWITDHATLEGIYTNAKGIDVEKASFLGDKSDSLIQSGGQLAVQAGLSAAGVPWWVTSGVTAFGGEVENALNQGATFEEAGASGFISAGAEILTEKISGGIKLPGMGGTLDDILTRHLATGISDKFVRTAAKMGIDIFGEGLEEALTNDISAFGQWLTYRDEEELKDLLFSEEAMQAKIEAFIGGAVLGGMGSASQVYQATRAGKDYTTGLTEDEFKVVNKAYNELVEKEGKASAWEKANQYMDDGRITAEYIESVLGGESYNKYKAELDAFRGSDDYKAYQKAKDERDSLPELERRYNELLDMKTGDKTGRQLQEEADLKRQLEEIANSTAYKDLQAKLSPEATRLTAMRDAMRAEVYSKVKDTRLAESYRELARSKQKLDMDASKYTGNAKQVVQAVVDSGLMDNTNQSKRTVEFLAKLAADKGLSVEALSNEAISKARKLPKGYTVHGYISKDGKMTLNMESPRLLQTTAGHEITHIFEGTELYNELSKVAKDFCIAKEGLDGYNKRITEAESIYGGDENTTPEGEVVADIIGQYIFTDEDFVNNLTANKDVFDKVYSEIKYLCKIAVTGSKEKRQLEKVKRAFDRVYQQTIEFEGEADGKVQNSYSRPDFNKDEWSIVNRRKHSEFDNPKYDLDNDKKWMYANEKGYSVFAVYSKSDAEDPTVLYGTSGKKAQQDYADLNDYLSGRQKNAKRSKTTLDRLLGDLESKYGNGSIGVHPAERGQSAIGDVPFPLEESGSNGRRDFVDGTENLRETELTEYDNEASGTPGASFVTFSNDYQAIRNLMKEGDTGESDVQYSVSKAETTKADNDYLAAINRGNTDVVQKIVDDAAKNAGYTIKAYHGTGYNFTVFDKSKQGDNYKDWGRLGKGFYFAPTAREAETWAELSRGNLNKVMPVYLRSDTMLDSFEALPDNLKDTIPADWDSLTKRLAEKHAYNYIEYMQEFGYNVQKILQEKGYDGINGHVEFVVFDPEQVKSADPVTYDDKGNVIPLSERFNEKKEDIRFSVSKDSTGKELSKEQADFFKDSKAVNELGELVRVYHGTRKADFTVFKRNATYFTDNKDMADSYSPNGDMYEGYVNITKPFEIDAQGEKWSKIPIDEETKEFLERYGSSVFEEDGEWRTSPADIVAAIEEAIEEGEVDYDGIIIRNVDDTGSYYKDKDSHLATDYITFNSNQFKNVDNTKPTAGPDIRFSMSKEEKAKMDKDYMDAVAKNDDDTLNHLVREYAKQAMPETKLLDENGNPRIVYHGTNTGDFTVFNPDYIGMSSGDSGFFGMGFYFAYSKGEASYYGASRVIPAYLDLKNPFNFDKELRTYNGKKAMSGHAPDAVALMNFADKFPDIAMSITLDVAKEYGKVESISLFEFSKEFKNVIENKYFEVEETVNDYGEKETIVTADPQTHSYEYNGETVTYRDFGFQKRWYGTPNEYDVAYEYLANSVYSYIDMPRMTNIILDNNREFTAELKNRGYDGTIQSEYGDEAVVFDPSQIKSAEPITYDDNGEVIPLSKRFDRSNDDIRYSVSKIEEQVNAYQYDIEHGDMLGAELAVEELANLAMPDSKIRDKNGRLIPVYHGTKEMFWEFDPTIGGGKNGTAEGFGIYLSDDQEVTNAYGDRQIKMFANITKPATSFDKTITSGTLVKLIKDTCERQARHMVEEEGYDSLEDALRDTWISNYVMTYDMSIEQAYRTVANDILKTQTNDKDIIHEVMFGMAIRDYAAAMDFYRNSLTPVTGFDGFVTKWENNGKTSNIYMAFDSSQLKSADAVTTDDNGNVIPITDRFDFGKKDIRYSVSQDGDDDIPFGYKSAKDLAYNKEDAYSSLIDYESLLPDSADETIVTDTEDDEIPIKAMPSEIKTVQDRLDAKIANTQAELDKNRQLREESLQSFDDEIAGLRQQYESKKNKNTKVANDLLRRIEKLTTMKNNVDASYAKRISDLEARVEKLNTPEYRTSEQRRAKMQEYTDMWEAILGDTSTWKDLPTGLSYKTKTMRRFLRKVVRDANGKPNYELADEIYNELETKYDHNEALLKQESVKLKEVFKKLDLNQYEDTYAHMMGEFRHNPQTTLTEDVVKEYYEKHKNKINTEKVDTAITEARKTFDALLVRVNSVLREQGMKEIPFRQGYFPHFTNPKQGWLAKLFNWKPINNEIPTSIAGLTEQFDPQRSWQGFNKQRQGDTTDYSLYQGLDTYIHGALDWIYHIEDLQKRRSLENYIRFIHSEEGVKQKIDEIKANEYYDADEAQQQIDLVLAEAKNPLNNLVVELRARTNTLANKKASMDRGMEEATNRKIYSVMTNLNNRINANMVVGSVSSALTNFIPMVQSWHQVSPVFTVRGLRDMIRSTVHDDGMVEKSDFLTNRLIEEEKLYQTGWDKVSDKAAWMMNVVDNITSQTVWRSKYLQNIKEGMSETAAIKDADQFAKNLMAGRSRGNAPSIYDAKNPLIKLATAFQLEVANQYGYMFEDVPQDASPDAKGKLRLAKGYATAMVGAYVYNALYSSLVGRDAAFDPIGIIEDLFGDLFDDDDEDEDDVQDALLGLGENILQEIPYVGGLLGGGRVPMSSALPYSNDSTPVSSFLGDVEKAKEDGNWKPLAKEMLKPLYYLALPVGGGQIKKMNEGIAMFDDDLPISGSYTDSGGLRFPVEKTVGNVAQAVVFGQYASKNARDYFDNGWSPLGEKQIEEYIDLDIPIRDYREYRAGISSKDSAGEKLAYIDSLDLPISKKNILANNVVDRKEPIDMADWDKYDGLEEYDYAKKYPEKHKFLEANGITVKEYNDFDEETKEAWSWAYKNPKKYAMSKAVTSDLMEYRKYANDLGDIRADKDSKGDSISGSAKAKKLDYINSLNIDYGAKLILYKSQYKTDDMYNYEIVEYLNSIEEFSYEDRIEILEELGFTIVGDGTVQWD